VTLDLILIGIAITLDPLPLTAYLVLLPSKRGVKKGAAFILGWLVSLAIVVAVTVLITGNNPPKQNTAPSLAALAVKIAIGVGLIAIAVRQRRKMHQPKKPKKPPKWQASVDNMSPWFAMGLAPLLQPWGLIAAGVATVVDANCPAPPVTWRCSSSASSLRRHTSPSNSMPVSDQNIAKSSSPKSEPGSTATPIRSSSSARCSWASGLSVTAST